MIGHGKADLLVQCRNARMPDGRFIVTQLSRPISVKTEKVRRSLVDSMAEFFLDCRTVSPTPGIAQCYRGEDARSHVFLHEESGGQENGKVPQLQQRICMYMLYV